MSNTAQSATNANAAGLGIPFSEWALSELKRIRDQTITIDKMEKFLGTVLEWAKTKEIPLDEMESQLFDALFEAGISIGEMPALEQRGDGLYGELDIGELPNKISATC